MINLQVKRHRYARIPEVERPQRIDLCPQDRTRMAEDVTSAESTITTSASKQRFEVSLESMSI